METGKIIALENEELVMGVEEVILSKHEADILPKGNHEDIPEAIGDNVPGTQAQYTTEDDEDVHSGDNQDEVLDVIGDVSPKVGDYSSNITRLSHGVQEPQRSKDVKFSEEILQLVSSRSEEKLDPHQNSSDKNEVPLETLLQRGPSSIPSMFTLTDKTEKSSKIPRGVDTSILGPPNITLNRNVGLSFSSFSLSSNENRLKSSISKVSVRTTDSKKTNSPRIASFSVRGMEAELKKIKKRYFEVKNEYDMQEQKLMKIAENIWSLMERISQASGKERSLDEDMKSIRNFIVIKIGNKERETKTSVDLTPYEHIFTDVNKTWQDMVTRILDSRNAIIKWLESKKFLQTKPEFYSETHTINKHMENSKEVIQKKVRNFLKKLEATLRNSLECKRALECQIEKYESKIKEQEEYTSNLKKVSGDSSREVEKLLTKQKEMTDKYTTDLLHKNKEIESFKQENTRVTSFNKMLTKTVGNKERENKESLSQLNKQYEEATRKAKEFEKRYEEVKEKLGNLQMRENSLKKRLYQSCQSEAGDAASGVPTKALEVVKAELHVAQEKITRLEYERKNTTEEIKKVVQENMDRNYEDKTDATSADETEPKKNAGLSEETIAFKTVIRRLRGKIKSLLSAQKEAELDIKRKIEDLALWEEELSMREDRLYEQNNVVRVREQLLSMLKSREIRRRNSSFMSYEAVCKLLEDKKAEVEDLKVHIQLLKRQDQSSQKLRIRMEQDNALLHKKLRASRSKSPSTNKSPISSRKT